MPLISSNYNPPLAFKNSHFSTIYNGLIRKVTDLNQERERICLSDGDFLDLDWSYCSTPTDMVCIVIHGLEGDAQRAYVQGAAKILSHASFDVCAINLRGCSGEPNRTYRSYHSGATEDLRDVIEKNYSEILKIDFSKKENNQNFWFISKNKEEPRLADRYHDDGSELEQPLAIARDIKILYERISNEKNSLSIGKFLIENNDLRHFL